MKLGTPTTELPPHTQKARGKYSRIYEALHKLRDGEWLPVEFDSAHDAYNFRVAATTSHVFKIEAKLRGNMVYVRLKSRRNGSRAKEKR